MRLEAEIYPLAFSNPKSVAAGLGAGGEYDRTVAPNRRSSNENTIAVPVTQSH
jgi:hypothetical protein